MDVLTVIEAAKAPISLSEIKEFCGVAYSEDRLDSLVHSGEVQIVEGTKDIYWSPPPSLKGRTTLNKVFSPGKVEEKSKTIRQIVDLRSKLISLTQEFDILNSKKSEFVSPDLLKQHINRLHKYNELKDIGQLLIGKIAEMDGKSISSVYEDFDLPVENE
jgi:hypothetical protein